MGMYVTFSIAGQEVLSTKNSIDSAIMTLFVEDDKVARLNGRLVPVAEVLDRDYTENDELFLAYESRVHIVKDRLEVMGYTMRRVRAIFDQAIGHWRNEHEGEEWDTDGLRKEYDLISNITFDEWADALRAVLKTKVTESDYSTWLTCHPLAPLLLGELTLAEDWLLGFPTNDSRPVVRAALEGFGEGEVVTQDLSDALHSGWNSVREKLCEQAREDLASDYPLSQKTIVLTEGTSDAWILAGALKVLYPHLVEYFSFLDFENARTQGGAGSLVQIIKAFAGAGVANRVVAVFDNDTGAEDALLGLKGVKLPSNIKIVRCPPLELARNYPSLGPTGLQSMDVNGLAASIEMYLGEDVLRDRAGTLTPIQWRGYSDKLHRYQGEIMGKEEVKARFLQKIGTAPNADVALKLPEWQPMRSLLRCVLTAFG